MNPYLFTRDSLFAAHPTGVELDAIYAMLTLAADAYTPGDFVRGPANNEFDFVIRTLTARFSTSASTPTPSPAILKLQQLCSSRLGQ